MQNASWPTCLADLPVRRLPVDGLELLGCPIGTPDFCSKYVSGRVIKIRQALSNLNLIEDPQIEIALIRSCLGLPRFAFALQTAPPCQIAPAIQEFDDLIEEVFLDRFGLSLSPDQHSQARLPISLGGFGLLKASDSAAPAYLGSLVAALPRIRRITRGPVELADFEGAQDALVRIRVHVPSISSNVNTLPLDPALTSERTTLRPQHVLSCMVQKAAKELLVANASSPRNELRLKAVSRDHAGDWLTLPQSRTLG